MTSPAEPAKPKRRISPYFAALYGVLVIAGGAVAYFKKGSLASLAVGGGLGLVVLVAGVWMLRGGGRRAWDLAQWATLAVVSAMLYRLIMTGGIVPAVPVMATGLALSFVMWSEQPDKPAPPA